MNDIKNKVKSDAWKKSTFQEVDPEIYDGIVSRFTVSGGTSYGELEVMYTSGSPTWGGGINLPSNLGSVTKIEVELWDSDGNVYFTLGVVNHFDRFNCVINCGGDPSDMLAYPSVWSTCRLAVNITETGLSVENRTLYYDFDIKISDV